MILRLGCIRRKAAKRVKAPPIISGALLLICLLSQASAFGQCTWGGTSAVPAPAATPIRSLQGLLRTPARIAVDATGNLYATDPNAGTVIVRDPVGQVISFRRGFISPFAIRLDSAGNVLVGEQGIGSVTIFNSLWEQQAKLGAGDGEFLSPTDIAIDPDPLSRKIYVTDGDSNVVKVYEPSGQFLFSFGGPGAGDGQFDFPSAVYVSAGGLVFVGDQKNDRVEVFDRAGAFLRCFARAGGMMGPRKVGTIQGLTGDALGRIYMADSFQGRVQVFDTQGVPLAWIGSFGEGPAGQLRTPVGICIDASNRLFVASHNSSRIEVFGLDTFSDPGQIPNDGVSPTVAMSSAAPASTNLSPIHVTATFSESVVGLDVTGISATNASVTNFTGAGAEFGFDLVPSGQGLVAADVDPGVCKDVNGNDNLPGTFSRSYDSIAPLPVITGQQTLTNATRTLAIDFGEVVNGFNLSGLAVANGTAGNLQPDGPSASYTLDVLGSGAATVSVSIPAGVATDDAANPNSATSSAFTYPFDDVAPTAIIAQTTSNATTADVLAFTVDFSESVGSSLTAANLSLTPGSLNGNVELTGSDPDYTVTVTLADPNEDGTVAVSISGDGVMDLAGNPYTGDTSPMYTIHNWRGFTAEPTDAQLYDGDSHTLSLDAEFGPITPAFQWKWDNVAKTIQDGPATPAWTLTNVTPTDSGSYWCEVNYDGAIHESARADLSIMSHLQIIEPPAGGVELVGDSHTFNVETDGGYPPLTYTWRKDGVTIEGASTSSYTKTDLTQEDSGTYTVEVADAYADVRTASADLTVDTQGTPVAGVAGLVALTSVLALTGVILRRRR